MSEIKFKVVNEIPHHKRAGYQAEEFPATSGRVFEPPRIKLFRMVILLLSLIVVLSCSSISISEGEQPDPSTVETEIAFGIMSTTIANQQMTLQAIQAQMTLRQCAANSNKRAAATAAHSGYSTIPGTQQNQPTASRGACAGYSDVGRHFLLLSVAV
jgi:hypothetical protein